MSKIKVALVGAAGRMGREICALATKESAWQISAQIDLAGQHSFRSLSEIDSSAVDVVIDFSSPDMCLEAVDWCARHHKPLVSGTTGLSDLQFDEIRSASSKTAILWAANMSTGVAVFREMIKNMKSIAEDFDFQIEELHHKHKKDRPSGTALVLQEDLQLAIGRQAPEPLSVRGGGIFGIHKLWAMSDEEVISIEHTALNRRVFARGALKMAQWIVQQAPGQYTVSDAVQSTM